ncbi:MAG TPA: hypothetical protein VNK49_08390 [Anaerolineales bacterium]|nr:hypothetical protein [Anaerolineales bacterium]
MLLKLSTSLRKYANGWLVLAFFAGLVLFHAIIFPAQQANLRNISGGTNPIDLLFFYTPEEVYAMVASYGEEGRAAYRAFELTGDIVYPILYTLFFTLFITWLFQRGFQAESPMQRLNITPLGAWLFDLLENFGIAGMLSVYPSTPAALAWASAVFTLFKWLFVGTSILLSFIGIAMALKNTLKNHPKELAR